MYRVTVITDDMEYPLHEPKDDTGELMLLEPVVTQEIGKNGTFTFRITPRHPNKDKIQALKSEIRVFDEEELLFSGRHIGDESDFYNVGSVTCEGELAYLLDSIQRPYDFTGSGTEFFRHILNIHNSQVEERKRFEPGDITVPDKSAEIHRISDECRNTLETMKLQLTDVNGGILKVRYSDGKRYLDYVSDYGGINDQVIRFGENMLDMSCSRKPTGIITALIPYGAAIESEDSSEEDRILDIAGVNEGRDYIYDEAAVDAYGWIWGTQTFDDVTDPEILLKKAEAFLKECIALPETLELKAVDLGLMDIQVEKLKLGYWTTIESIPHSISKKFMLSKKVTHLDDPAKDEVVLGRTQETFTGAANKDKLQMTETIQRVAASTSREINKKVENATQLITGGKGGYVVLDVDDPETGKRAVPWRILVMDAPEKDTAVNVIQINKNGIGFSTSGIGGPYANAWTIDGNLVADFITSGTMVADRVRGGCFEVGGSDISKDGVFVVKDKNNYEIARIDKNGLEIRYKKNVGFKADGNTVEFGGFEAADGYGRQLLQSTDEVTGMSGEPSEEGQWYMWAGWHGEDDYAFAVNNLQEVHVNTLWVHSWDKAYEMYKKQNKIYAELNPSKFEMRSLPYIIYDLYNIHNLNAVNIETLGKWCSNLDERLTELE